MDLEVCGFAVALLVLMEVGKGGTGRRAYYAGNSSTLNAVATTAHCAIEGYKSAIETFPNVDILVWN